MNTTNTTGRWLGWLVIVVAVVMVAQTAYAQYQDHKSADRRAATVRCLSRWATDFQDALDARTGASTTTTKLRAKFDASAAAVFAAVPPVISPTANAADAGHLESKLADYAKAYRAVQQASKHQRDAATDHPYPDPPARCVH